LADRLSAIDGVDLVNGTFFNEFTLRLNRPAKTVVDALVDHGVLGGVPFSRLGDGQDDLLLVAVTETASADDMAAFEQALRGIMT